MTLVACNNIIIVSMSMSANQIKSWCHNSMPARHTHILKLGAVYILLLSKFVSITIICSNQHFNPWEYVSVVVTQAS